MAFLQTMKAGNPIAIIDCGTNTFHLLVGESVGNTFRLLHRSRRVVKLGGKSDPFSPIADKALERAYTALRSYHSTMKKMGVNRVMAIGTAALRDSSNANDFLEKVKRELGFNIRLIPGEIEADLIYAGVRRAVQLGQGRSLVMDIGGGSTEFILCNSKCVFWKKSYRLGAARLLASWSPGDPPTDKDLERFDEMLQNELSDLIQLCRIHSPDFLIGASGSFETVVSLLCKSKGLPTPRSNEIGIPVSDYYSLHHKLIRLTQSQRIRMPGMLRMRADMMVPASLLTNFVLKNTGIMNMKLSRFALKEGLFFESVGAGDSLTDLVPEPFH